MSLVTYADLKAAIADWLDRGDMAARIPDFVRLAEATLNKVLRSTRMVGQASVVVTANTRFAAAPSDMLEPIFLTAADEDYPLEQVAPQQLIVLRQMRLKAAGAPRFFALVGRRIEFAPTPAAGGTFELSYYQAIPPLVGDGDTNWLLTHDPDLYLYTALLHAAQFLHDGAWAQIREILVLKEITAAVTANRTIQMDAKAPGPSLDTPSDPVRA